ncbi:MAG: Ig-like domain repeat protein [Isosphaeraceae bacterium]
MSWLPVRSLRPASSTRRPGSRNVRGKRRKRPEIEGLEIRITPVVKTWLGVTDDLWSTGTNWSDGTAPQSGDALIFDSNASGFLTTNDLTPGLSLAGISVTGQGYDFEGYPVTMTGPVAVNTGGTNTFQFDMTLDATGFQIDGGGTVEVTTSVAGNGGFYVTGASNLLLDGPGMNTFVGGNLINSGVVTVAKTNALGFGSIEVDQGGELDLTGDSTIPNDVSMGSGVTQAVGIRNVAGWNTISGNVALTSDAVMSSDNGSLTIGGVISDGGSGYLLRKYGPGSLTLAGASTATGTLELDGGAVVVNGTLGGGVAIAGGNLAGNGTIQGAVNQMVGGVGVVTPGGGNATTTLTTTGYNIGAGVTTDIGIGGPNAGTDYDQILNQNGYVGIDGSTLNVHLLYGYLPNVGDHFTILKNQDSFATNGTFAGLPEGATFTVGPVKFAITYQGIDGNDVVLTAVGVTDVWTGGGGSNNWSDPANWNTNIAPGPNWDLVFPAGASRLGNVNDLAPNTAFQSITITGPGYDFSGNPLQLASGFSVGSGAYANINFPIVLSANQTFDIAAGAELDVYSSISGGHDLTQTGNGRLALLSSYAPNTYNDTTVLGGKLLLASPFVVVPGALTVGDNAGHSGIVELYAPNQIFDSSSVTVNDGSRLDLRGYGDQFNALTLEGGEVDVNGGELSLLSTLTVNPSPSHTMSLINGPGSFDLASNNVDFQINHDSNLTVDARINASIVDGGVVKNGAGTIAFAVDNSYGGDTQVNAGVIQVESDHSLGLGYLDSNITRISAGASVYFNGPNLTCDEYFLGVDGRGPNGEGAIYVASGTTTLVGYMTIGKTTADDARLGAADGTTLIVDSSIDDGPATLNLEINAASTGRVILGGDNRFDGDINVLGGYLRASSDNALGDPSTASNITVADAATLEFAGGITTPATKTLSVQLNGVQSIQPKLMNISGWNTVSGGIDFQGNTEIYAANGSQLILDGSISEDASGRRLISDGAGTLVLNGTNSYTGTTFVLSGTLLVNGSIATSSDVQVHGGLLGGTGVTSPLAVFSGGAVAPGYPTTGVLNTGDATLNGGSSLNVELDGTTAGTSYSQLNVSGAVNLGNATLTVTLGYTPVVGDTFTIINNDGSDLVGATFLALPEGATFYVGTHAFQISYVGGDGNDVTLTTVPRVLTWTGAGGTDHWSDPNNWQSGLVPQPGDNLVFPAGAAQLNNYNDFGGTPVFGSITVQADGYLLRGNAIGLSGGFTTFYAAGSTTLWVDINIAADQSFTLASGTEVDATSVLSGTHNLTKDGAGRLVLMGTSTFSGATTINTGPLELRNSLGLGSGSIAINTTGELDLNGSLLVSNPIRNNSQGNGIFSTNGHSQLLGPISFWENATIDVAPGSILEINSSIIQLNPGRSLTKVGTGELWLDQQNFYTGGTDVRNGTLETWDPFATGTTGLIYLEAGATLELGTNLNAPSSGIYVGGVVDHSLIRNVPGYTTTLNGTINMLGNVDFLATAANLTVTGNIIGFGSGSVSAAAGGTGAVIFQGNSTYTGQTYVLGGTMEIDGNFSTSSQFVVLGGFLQGNGVVSNILAPSGAVGPLLNASSLTASSLDMGSGSTWNGVLNNTTPGSGYSLLNVSGSVSLGNATLNVVPNFTPDFGTVFTILDNTGSSAINGTFNGLPEGAAYVYGGQSFQVSYVGGDGNDVTLTATNVTTTTVTSSVNPSVYGQSVTFTADVTSSAGTATGTVTFLDNGFPLAGGIVTLADVGGHQIATYTTSTLSVGSHAITAVYSGSIGYTSSLGTLVGSPLIVNAAATTTGLNASSTSTIYGTSILFTATVSVVAPGNAQPSGLVQFFDGDPHASGVLLGTSLVNPMGIATLSTSTLNASVVPHSIIAIFVPDVSTLIGSDSSASPLPVNVAQATLTVTAANASREYGDANPTFGYDITGFVNGQTLGTSDVTGTPNVDTSATPTSPVGSSPYAINVTVGTLSSGNYTFQYVDGQLTLTSARLTVTADNTNREYGDANPTFTATFTGFKNGENLATSDVTGAPDLTTTATPSSPVNGSPYVITAAAGTLNSGNYTFQYVDGQLTLTKALLTVTADNTNRGYGDANPTFTATFTGFKNGENLGTSDVTGAPGLSTTATPQSSVSGSPYVITAAAGTLASGNYDFAFVNGQLNLTKAPLIITANNQIKVYGQAVPTLTASYSGFKNGETAADLDTLPTLFTPATAMSPVISSPLPIMALGASSGNYAIQYVPGLLMILQSATSVGLTAPTSILYGQTLTLTANVLPVAPGAGVPSGTIAFFDGSTLLGVAPITGASASLPVTNLVPGNHAFQAAFNGDSNFWPSMSPTTNVNVVQAQTTVGLTSPSLVVVGQPTSLSATVTAEPPTAGVPTGSVNFFDNGNLIGSVTLVNGAATLPITFTTAGNHNVYAAYLASGPFAGSNSQTSPVTVGMASARAVLTVSPVTAVTSQMLTLTATITAVSPSTGSPTGTVTFVDNGITLGVANVTNGQAILHVPAPMAGTPQTITAVYSGNSQFLSQTSNAVAETVNAASTTTSLAISPSATSRGMLQITATVTPVAPGGGIPGGWVVFYVDGRKFRTQNLVNGKTTILVRGASAMGHVVRAVFQENGSYHTSQSPPVRVTASTIQPANWTAKIRSLNAWRSHAKI